MKKLEVTISLRDAFTATNRMDDNRFIKNSGEWTSSNTYESVEFDEDEEEELESMDALREAIEDALPDCEYEINEVRI